MAAPTNKKIGTPYGKKGDWAAGYHTGADFLTPSGTPLYAPADSKIIYAGNNSPWGGAYGRCVIGETVVNGAIYRWMTAHMSVATEVKKGQLVKLGQRIGLSGNTGNTTGPHCHFEVRHTPFGYWDHLNPKVVLDVKAKPSTPVTAESVVYLSTAKPALLGREWPVDGPVVASAEFGHIVTSTGYTAKQKDGQVWVKNVNGYYFSKKYLKVKPAPPKPPALTVHAGTQNLPDKAKLPNTPARIIAGGKQVKAMNLSVVGGNEWVGRKGVGVASDHAKAMITSYGWKKPRLIVPTLVLNENYIAVDESVTVFVKQIPDKVLPSPAGGRHLTMAVLKDVKTNRKWLHYVTHLVDGKANGGSREMQAEVAAAELKRVAKAEGNLPIIGGGDMNRSDDLAPFLKSGLQRGRTKPKASNNRGFATYTTYTAKVPSKNLEHQMDDFYISAYLIVLEWQNRLAASGGVFLQPKPSDHSLVTIVVTIP